MKTYGRRLWLAGLVLFLWTGLAVGDPGKKVSINFNSVDIQLFIKFISDLTGKNFVVDDKVKADITIISPKEIDEVEAYSVFLSVLEVYGFAAVPSGNLTKIVPISKARSESVVVPNPSDRISQGDLLITRLIPLQYIDAAELANTVRPLISPTSYISSYRETNTIIITDFSRNVDGILSIIKELDVPGFQESFTVVPLRFASAKDLVKKVETAFGEDSDGAGGKGGVTRTNVRVPGGAPQGGGGSAIQRQSAFKLIADERINAVIIVANEEDTKRIKELIFKLDVEAPPGRSTINVYYLKNAESKKMAEVLTSLVQKAVPDPNDPNKKTTVNLKENVSITPDEATNSLVIIAAPDDLDVLREVIQKLDIRRLQVFVEALVMEVTSDKAREFGVEFRTTSNFTDDEIRGFGGSNFGNITSLAQNPLSAPQGLTVGVVDGTISFQGKEFLNIGGLLHALQTERGVNILSTPNLLTTDNEEAEIVVAENIPFVTGESQTTGGNTITTIERKYVGLTLRIRPQITEGEYVKLSIYQELSDVSPTQIDKAADLITFNRTARTSVVVKDRQNVVIGGLIRDDIQNVTNKIPILGDIPLLGFAFKNESKKVVKTNLVIFLRPHIIKDDKDIDSITRKRDQKMQGIRDDRRFEYPLKTNEDETKTSGSQATEQGSTTEIPGEHPGEPDRPEPGRKSSH